MSDLSPTEVAKETGLSRSLIYKLLEDGSLAGYKVRGRIRVRPEEVEAFRERNTIRPRPSGRVYEPPVRGREVRDGSFGGELKAIRGGRAA